MRSKGELVFPLVAGWRWPVRSVDLDIKVSSRGLSRNLTKGSMMRRILECHKNLLVVLATQLALVGAAHADDVSTSFEFNEVSGEFSLGNP